MGYNALTPKLFIFMFSEADNAVIISASQGDSPDAFVVDLVSMLPALPKMLFNSLCLIYLIHF